MLKAIITGTVEHLRPRLAILPPERVQRARQAIDRDMAAAGLAPVPATLSDDAWCGAVLAAMR